MKRLIILGLVLISAAACTSELNAIDLTASNNNATIDASLNQVININLESNVTTGYKWNVVGEPDAKVLKLVSSKYNEPAQRPGGPLVGAGGTETFQFQAVGVGTTTAKLAYARPFEPGQPPAKEFSVTVNVK